jgi:hypothetical protein
MGFEVKGSGLWGFRVLGTCSGGLGLWGVWCLVFGLTC